MPLFENDLAVTSAHILHILLYSNKCISEDTEIKFYLMDFTCIASLFLPPLSSQVSSTLFLFSYQEQFDIFLQIWILNSKLSDI